MESFSQNDRKSFYYFLLAIAFVHAFFMVVKMREHLQAARPNLPAAIKLKLMQPSQIDSSHKKQIVQSEDSESAQKTKDAFLSDKDRSFDRQTVAKKVDTFSRAAQGNGAETVVAQKSQSSAKKSAKVKDLKLSDFGLQAGDVSHPSLNRAPASQVTKGIKTGDPMAKGLSATNDYVEEVALGDFTHLNTVEYKYYGFFHRIRQKLEQFWGKSIREKAETIFRSGRRLPASDNLITNLQVTLNAKGEIIAVKILGASGVKELDDAAIESFNQAGPFPNPPKELLVNGKATIDWGFVVKS